MASEGEENHCLLRNDPGIHPAASPVWASGLGAGNDENDEVRKDRRGWEAEYREGPEWKFVPVEARGAVGTEPTRLDTHSRSPFRRASPRRRGAPRVRPRRRAAQAARGGRAPP